MSVIGRTTINPFLFYFGKACGYIAYAFFIPYFFKIAGFSAPAAGWIFYFACFIYACGTLIVFAGLFNLGYSTRVGLPPEATVLKTGGIYKITRNPIYLGLHVGNIAVIIFSQNIWFTVMVVISFVTYHYIIAGEEKFLLRRFGDAYSDYKKKVPGYLIV